MKKRLPLLLIIGLSFFTACQIDNCATCTVIIEDNAFAAEDACLGFASPYPGGYLLVAEFTDFYCDAELDNVILQEGEDVLLLCPGIFISRITTVLCD